MLELYSGEFLCISYDSEQSLFIQHWSKSPKTVGQFQAEMSVYTANYKIHKPKYTLWLQQNFTFKIDSNLQAWLEDNVNKPCYSYGNEKCAFVVGKDLLTHLDVINSFDEYSSCIIPKHFSTKENALDWIFERHLENLNLHDKKMSYDGIDKDGNLIFKVSSINIKQTIRALKKSLDLEGFIKKYDSKNNLLTKREKEILSLLSSDVSHEKIAESLFISIHTVRTHLKTIKQKLNFKNSSEFQTFIKTFY